MIILQCPYCHQHRVEDELSYGGESSTARPSDPDSASDEAWTDYLYMRVNRKGLIDERWCCSSGCGQWFRVARQSVTHEVTGIARFEDSPI
jgi:heterotetrameric sarcosine oxidase delta subunit